MERKVFFPRSRSQEGAGLALKISPVCLQRQASIWPIRAIHSGWASTVRQAQAEQARGNVSPGLPHFQPL